MLAKGTCDEHYWILVVVLVVLGMVVVLGVVLGVILYHKRKANLRESSVPLSAVLDGSIFNGYR